MSWPEAQLRRIARLEYGDSLADSERIAGTVPVYGSNGQVGQHNRANTDGPVIIIGRKGSFGKLQFSTIPVFAIDTTFFVDSTQTNADLRWLYYALGTLRLDELSEDVGVPGLSREKAYSQQLLLPPLDEQRAIANYLDRETARIDALVRAKEQARSRLSERWQVVMQHAVAGRVTASDTARRRTMVPWLTDLPAHWDEALLKLVAKLGSGHTPSRSHPEWWVNTTIPWITTGEVAQVRSDEIEYISETREKVSEVGMANSAAVLHPAGTVVLCRTASAGYSGIMASDMATSQDFATWTCGPLLRPRFLLLCLRAMRQDLLGRLAMGSTHKTIYMPDIESIKVPLPPVEEQDQIVDAAHAQHRITSDAGDKLGQQLSLLRERRQALITAAVRGQMEVAVAA